MHLLNLSSSKLFQNLMQTDAGGTGIKAPLGREGILDALNSADDSKDDLEIKDDELELEDKDENKDDTEGKDKDDKDDKEEKDELSELEEELKDPKPEDLELTTPVKKREILAKYPEIFKDFPSLEKAYYRELEYTKLFPTVGDAKDAVSAVRTLEAFEADLRDGKTTDLFKAILKDDPNAFAKLADSYMENLAAVDERAYHHVLGNITKDIVQAMVASGKKSENKDLQDSATILYEFMFGNKDWKPKSKLAIPDADDNDDSVKLKKEKEDWESSKFNERQTELMSGVTNRIKSVIDSNIDKKDEMTPFVKKNAVKEVDEKIQQLMKADTRFQVIVKQLWQKAKENKYSKEYMDKIESAHVSKAKSLLPTVIVSVKREALKGNTTSRKRVETKDKDDETIETTSRNSRRQSDNGNQTDKTKPLPGESSLDFLTRMGK